MSILKRLMQSHPEEGMKIFSRRSTITTDFIGLRFQIHNGKTFMPLRVTPEMVGHKFGEFSKTRKQAYHNADKEDPNKAANKAEEAMVQAASAQAVASGFAGADARKDANSAREMLMKLRMPNMNPAAASLTTPPAPTKAPAKPAAKKL
jgi:small subunit ribosomal protein S19